MYYHSLILTITDINECLTNNGGCAHNCTNTVGSYYCECPDGYVLQPNNHDCEGWQISYVCDIIVIICMDQWLKQE